MSSSVIHHHVIFDISFANHPKNNIEKSHKPITKEHKNIKIQKPTSKKMGTTNDLDNKVYDLSLMTLLSLNCYLNKLKFCLGPSEALRLSACPLSFEKSKHLRDR